MEEKEMEEMAKDWKYFKERFRDIYLKQSYNVHRSLFWALMDTIYRNKTAWGGNRTRPKPHG